MFPEMDIWLVNTGFFVAIIFFIMGIAFIKGGSNKKKDKRLLPLVIVGWIFTIASIIGSIALLILLIGSSGGITGTTIFIFVSPIFIIGGFIAFICVGLSSLTAGYRKDKDDITRKQSIIKGWALLLLAILFMTVIIVTLSILLTNYSNYRNEHPVRFM